ncbi:hypothetical protein FE257_011501 [Aspergillus nanangensis]|uniref:Xylanolytic transcriptional activator regulatory domain-containing protein n=1 Tax=Aspergillus nanangensis TaxID=2582783 RepID=A0AAD4CH07_ASPNN|nr:hypothetical protein FE257_011501 [Aspergillus nanangensis]
MSATQDEAHERPPSPVQSSSSTVSLSNFDDQLWDSFSCAGGGVADMGGDSFRDSIVRPSSRLRYETCEGDLNQWNIQAKLIEVHDMQTMVRHYLIRVNPRVPFLNSGQQLHDVERVLAGKEDDRLQLVAQIELIMALLQIMTDETAGMGNATPVGWREFQSAESLLQRRSWNGISNLRTIQCLILKTMYLIYADRNDLAYDTVAVIVRICFQLGLHNQDYWELCSPFEVHLRQRILWTVFCMERHVVESCQLPCLLRQSQLEVALPRHIDDNKLQAGQDVLPPEDPGAPIQHLYFSYQRAVLFTEVWDHRVLALPGGQGHGHHTDAHLVATIDSRIESLRAEMPRYLHWSSSDLPHESQINPSRRFFVRESLVLHLLLNSLRLLLRKPWIDDNTQTSTEIVGNCIEIMADSIHSLHSYHQTSLPDPIERYTSVRYLLDALRPLARIILYKSDLMGWHRRQARQSFDIGLSLLKEFSSHLTLARTELEKIQHMVAEVMDKTRDYCVTGSIADCLEWDDVLAWDAMPSSLGDICEIIPRPSTVSELFPEPALGEMEMNHGFCFSA